MEKKFVRPVFFREADPAQILFFGRVPQIYHDLLETWLSEELGWEEVFKNKTLLFPIRKLEVDYLRPLHAGQHYAWVLRTQAISENSVTLSAQVFAPDDLNYEQPFVKLSCVHVVVETESGKKSAVP